MTIKKVTFAPEFTTVLGAWVAVASSVYGIEIDGMDPEEPGVVRISVPGSSELRTDRDGGREMAGQYLAIQACRVLSTILPYGLKKFVRFAREVWGVDPAGKTEEEIANEGLLALEGWMKQIGVSLNITELGADESMLEDLADATVILDGGYHELSRDEVIEVFRKSL